MHGLIILQLLVHRQHSHSVQPDPGVPVLIPDVILRIVALEFEVVESVPCGMCMYSPPLNEMLPYLHVIACAYDQTSHKHIQ